MDLMEFHIRVASIEKILKSIQYEIVKIYTKLLDNGESSGIEQKAKSIEDYLYQVKDKIASDQFTIDHQDHDQDQVLGLTSNFLDFDDFVDFEVDTSNYDETIINSEVKPEVSSISIDKLVQECLNKRAIVVLEKLVLPPSILQISNSNANLKAAGKRKRRGRYRKIGQRKKGLISKSKLSKSKYERTLNESSQEEIGQEHLKDSLQPPQQDQDQKQKNEPEDMQYEKIDNNIYQCMSMSCESQYRKFPSFAKFEKHYERVHTLLKNPLNCGLDGCLISLYSHREMSLHKDQVHSSCSKCIAKFGTRRELLKHLKESHKTDQFKCKLCSGVYTDLSNLRQHFRISHLGKKKKSYSTKRTSSIKYNNGTKSKLKNQKINQKQDPAEDSNLDSNVFELYKGLCKKSLFKCDIGNCERVCVSKQSLEFHKYTHEIPDFDLYWKKSTCPVCRNIFASREAMRKHMIKEHLPPSLKYMFKCSTCDKTFARNTSLKRHKMLHSKSEQIMPQVQDETLKTLKIPQSYKCSMCDKTFSVRPHLDRHEKSHSRSKSVLSNDNNTDSPWTVSSKVPKCYKCSICDKILSSRNILQRHEKIHTRSSTTTTTKTTTNTTYNCPKPNCKRTFHLEKTLKDHLKLRHGNIKCPVENCIYYCTSQATYDTHMEYYHGEKLVCPICSQLFTRARLKAHNRDFHREFKCTFEGCPEVFSRELPLMKHQAGHDPNLKPEFLCNICGVAKWTKRCLGHHVKLYHKTKLRCPYEGCSNRVGNPRVFTEEDKLTEHINKVHKDNEKIIASS